MANPAEPDISFRECPGDFEKSAAIIREAFATVAEEFNITREKVPTNGAFIEAAELERLYEKGIRLFDVWEGGSLSGFVALEDAGGGVYYLEKLSVVPAKRHRGIGRRIMDFAADYVKKHSASRISIAVIDENTVLKRWYKEYGFTEVRTKKFDHLPFTVCFLELPIGLE
jgi:ribosomal protein S18 acetylase RimI-like enzyme